MKYVSWPLIITMSLLFASEVLAQRVYYSYTPPQKGGPSLRVDPAFRSSGCSIPSDFKLHVIAPERLAYTINPQPTLYWCVNKKLKGKFRLTITKMGSGFSFSDPLVEKSFAQEVKAGEYNEISLAGLEKQLENNINYKWTVALECDKDKRSLDIGQTGGVRYMNKLKKSVNTTNLNKLARKGIWYDLFENANSTQREDLLKQVGLSCQ